MHAELVGSRVQHGCDLGLAVGVDREHAVNLRGERGADEDARVAVEVRDVAAVPLIVPKPAFGVSAPSVETTCVRPATRSRTYRRVTPPESPGMNPIPPDMNATRDVSALSFGSEPVPSPSMPLGARLSTVVTPVTRLVTNTSSAVSRTSPGARFVDPVT